MTDTTREIWLRLSRLVFDRHDRRKQVGEATGLSFARVKVLRRIARGPCTLAELAERVASDRPYTTLIVDALEERGLVARRPNPADRRSKLVGITEDGQALADKANEVLSEPPAELSALDEADRAELLRLLRKLD